MLSPAEVLTSATSNNGELLQRPGELGVIQPDAYADLLVVDGDPLSDINLLEHQGRNLLAIMKGGAFVKNALG